MDTTRYLITGKTNLSPQLFCEPKNIYFIKPEGGLWASTYTPESEYKSHWQEWAYCNMPTGYKQHGTVIGLKNDSKIYTIDSYNDLINLHDRFKMDDSPLSMLFCLDFEAISKVYDGIHLTEVGEQRTRHTRPSLYGWDCDCILILNYECVEILEII